mmetsp:Transcript_6601/g.14978  ORF Transcript_6601/g.14978 Transcript_6601/m.14978 type:complete len:331 (+) Transcript_6601:270-1262(+)
MRPSPVASLLMATVSLVAPLASVRDGQEGNGGHELGVSSSMSPHVRCGRVPSRDAADMIANCTQLLVITSDASGRGGGSKHDGLATVLRLVNGSSLIPSQECDRPGGDLFAVFSKRTAPRPGSEISALAFGMKNAQQIIPPSWRKRVVVLTDSEAALSFFCDALGAKPTLHRRGGRGARGRQGSQSADDASRRILKSLLSEADGIHFSKVRSSSRSIVPADADQRADRAGIGFLDHDICDYLSSETRYSPNKFAKNTMIRSDQGLDELPLRLVAPLDNEDMQWLENSDDVGAAYWTKSAAVLGQDARDERQLKNERKTALIRRALHNINS